MQRAGVKLDSQVPWDADITFGEAMLTPTTIYVKQLEQARQLDLKVRCVPVRLCLTFATPHQTQGSAAAMANHTRSAEDCFIESERKLITQSCL